MQPATILDVLENALDGDLTAERVSRISASEMEALYESVNQFYDCWQPTPPAEELLRVHLGGWIARTANRGLARDLLHAALLYAHEVVIYDPVAAYFEPSRTSLRRFAPVQGTGINADAASVNLEARGGYVHFADDLMAHRSHVGEAVEQVAALAPLIRGQVAIPVPHLRLAIRRQQQIFAAVRHLLKDRDYLALLDSPVDRPALTQDEGPNVQFLVSGPRRQHDALIQNYGDAAYYLSRTLAVAEAAQSSYLPPSATEWGIYEQRLRRLGERLGHVHRELYVAPAIIASELPFLTAVPSETVLAARESSDAFEFWRAALRTATRQVRSIPSLGEEFVSEAKQVMHDSLGETAEEVQRQVRRSAVLMRSLRGQSLNITTGVASVSAVAAVTGEPIRGLAGIAGSGMLSWLADALLPAPLSGTNAVLAHLVHHRGEPAPDEDWPTREALVISPKAR